ncbi:MAG: flagellar M-ring protein FliF, partial [Dietzia sp.]|nr:flagellar M-ring protein FliF [Dietzia sp.]
MPGQLSATARRFREMFADFTTGQKAVTVVAVLAVLLGGVLFATWAAKPTMVPLYSGMESADAAAVVEELSAAGTPYELADGGRTVLVPQADVQQLRLDMSAAGLPQQAPTGYALLDEQGVTTSEFRQRVDFQRALEGELAATISTIDSVQA